MTPGQSQQGGTVSLSDGQFEILLYLVAIWWLIPLFLYSLGRKPQSPHRLAWYLAVLFLSWPAFVAYLIGRNASVAGHGEDQRADPVVPHPQTRSRDSRKSATTRN